jgi:hypothetical protein
MTTAADRSQFEGDDFRVYVPSVIEIVEKADEGAEVVRSIGGWCSTEDLDRQGEVVIAKGLDFSEFVQFGWFNDNHRQDTDAALGYPKVARLEKGRWWTEGILFPPGYAPADRVWELAKALQKSGGRKLGFSIEGKVLERDGRNKILRAKIRDVAVTRSPVNTNCTFQILTKSFAEPEAVEAAALKAISASTGKVLVPEDLEGLEVRREANLSFKEAVAEVRRRWPHLDEAICRRAAAFVFTKE